MHEFCISTIATNTSWVRPCRSVRNYDFRWRRPTKLPLLLCWRWRPSITERTLTCQPNLSPA